MTWVEDLQNARSALGKVGLMVTRCQRWLCILGLVIVSSPAWGVDFIRGDNNADGNLNLADVIVSLGFQFGGQSAPCLDALDFDASGAINLGDVIQQLAFLFSMGPPPAAPFPNCGAPAMALLGCASHLHCSGVPPTSLLPHDFYVGPDLNQLRYGHRAVTLQNGTVLVVGGTDDRHLTSLNSAELFDQSVTVTPAPQSIDGAYIDSDFNGDPIELSGAGRIFHTATLLGDGNLLVCGGTEDILLAQANGTGEIYDASTRNFGTPSLQVSNNMVVPRFRHTADLLDDGRVLITGGQASVFETVIDPNFPPGDPLFQIDVLTFPAIEEVEVFDPTSLSFTQLVDTSGNQVELAGDRADHASVRIAGPDQILGNADDWFAFAGGFDTLSSIFAPQSKLPLVPQLTPSDTLEVFNPSTGAVFSAPGITIDPRMNGAQLLNLGQFSDATPDGVAGVGNTILVTCGDDGNVAGNGQPNSTTQSQVIAITFGGMTGVNFFDATAAPGAMNAELNQFDPSNMLVGRSSGAAIMAPNARTYEGSVFAGNWVLTTGGADLSPSATTLDEELEGFGSNEIRGVMFFDPFYHPLTADPTNLTATRSMDNPTGVVGGWLNGDMLIPEDDLNGYAGPTLPDVSPLVGLNEGRVYHTLNLIPGVDQVLGTADDRVLVTGGGDSWITDGGAPVGASSEIYVQP